MLNISITYVTYRIVRELIYLKIDSINKYLYTLLIVNIYTFDTLFDNSYIQLYDNQNRLDTVGSRLLNSVEV